MLFLSFKSFWLVGSVSSTASSHGHALTFLLTLDWYVPLAGGCRVPFATGGKDPPSVIQSQSSDRQVIGSPAAVNNHCECVLQINKVSINQQHFNQLCPPPGLTNICSSYTVVHELASLQIHQVNNTTYQRSQASGPLTKLYNFICLNYVTRYLFSNSRRRKKWSRELN